MPVDLKRYPSEWREISQSIRFGRAGGVCEWPGCTARHGEPNPVTGSKIVLTTAHLPIDANGIPCDAHDKMHATEFNLLALCQRHHLMLDHADHMAHAAETRRQKRLAVQPELEIV